MARLHAAVIVVDAPDPHPFQGNDRACSTCGAARAPHDVGERPLILGGLRCGRCARRGESMWCRCSRARIIADLRDLLAEARALRRDPLDYYTPADVAVRVAGAGAIRRTLATGGAIATAR
jgi:hypothetical protein